MTFGPVLMLFMKYCLDNYGEEMILSKWVEFCEKNGVERFTERALDSAFNDTQLKDETLRFVRDIGELARKSA